MHTSIIRVYHNRYNCWAENVKVCLEFTGWTSLGFTDEVYTDHEGRVLISHKGQGEANIYVNGSKVGRMQAPGSTTVHIN